jgi:hypothetical protein
MECLTKRLNVDLLICRIDENKSVSITTSLRDDFLVVPKG